MDFAKNLVVIKIQGVGTLGLHIELIHTKCSDFRFNWTHNTYIYYVGVSSVGLRKA